jgi:hypothetical protein
MDRKYIDIIKSIIKKRSEKINFKDFQSEEFYNAIVSDFNKIMDVFNVKLNEGEIRAYIRLSQNEYLHENPITVDLAQSLVKQNKHWLTEARQEKAGWINNQNPLSTYRTRYLEYLRRIGRAENVISDVEKSSITILQKIEDPLIEIPFLKKGLVVGNVQSGKTGNFNAVINSCIDLGYRLVIVLSGGMEDLRRQTQERIEKEVEGREIKEDVWNGVGNIAKFGGRFNNKEQIVIPTALDKDFNLNLTDSDFALDKINVLVCKKNSSILRNILIWLKRFSSKEVIENIPLLIIDDEADNASLNNLGFKGKEEASKINLQIRCIINLFAKCSYIGYTATPFANILQDRNDKPNKTFKTKIRDEEFEFQPIGNLFPEDFIILLNPPSNYIGPKNFFQTKISETKKIPTLITIINDWYDQFPYRVRKDNPDIPFNVNEEIMEWDYLSESNIKSFVRDNSRAANKADLYPKSLPKSLEDAVKCFIISIAVRIKRKPLIKDSILFQKHNSMLIHISRFTFWQDRTTELLKVFFNNLKNELNNEPINSPVYNDFRRVWNKYYIESIESSVIKEYLPDDYQDEFMVPVRFNDILDFLILAVNDIEIVCANSNSQDSLDYSNKPKKYIVVGGNRLSRGFTLEGLTINYFVRDTNFADSLLQMGRWFGYRPGYLDCCKLFTTIDTVESYDFSTSVIEDVEAQFYQMASKGRTPADFAIKVMNDPDVIKITRPAILKNAKTIRWSYSDKLDQTTKFNIDKHRIEDSWKDFVDYFRNKNYNSEDSSLKYFDTNADEICKILKLKNAFTNPNHYEPLISFISDVKSKGYLNKWSIAIRRKGEGKLIQDSKELFGFEINTSIRRINSRNTDRKSELLNYSIFTASGNSSNIITSGSDFAFAISEEEKIQAEKKFREEKNSNNYPEKIYRNRLDKNHGVLIIYPIDLSVLREENDIDEFFNRKNINTEIPLLGFAVGIPNLGDKFEKEYFVQNGFLDENGVILRKYLEDEQADDDLDENYFEDELSGLKNE